MTCCRWGVRFDQGKKRARSSSTPQAAAAAVRFEQQHSAHTHTKTWVPKPIWSWHHSAWRSVIHAQMQQMLSLRFSAWLKMALVLCFTVWRLFKEWLSDWSFMSDFRMQKFTSSVSRIPSFWKWHSILNVQVLDWIYSTVIRWTVRVTVCQTLKLHDLLH